MPSLLSAKRCVCGTEFTPWRRDQIACSPACSSRAHHTLNREVRLAAARSRRRDARVLRCIELGLPITASETELRRAAQRRAEVGYKDAHTRVRTVRGKASQYACVDCSGAAAEWSYNHTDPDERVQRLRDTRSRAGGWVRELAYSLDPAFYDPRCRPCHIRHDQGRHALPVVG